MNDIKNLDWVNAKNSELNRKHRHYLKEYNLLTEEKKLKTKIWQYNKSWFLTRIKC